MKNILKTILLLYILFQTNTYAQKMVENVRDLYKLEDNQQLFIFRPLKNVLKEIKPKIETAYIYNTDCTYAFYFKFANNDLQVKKEDTTTLVIYMLYPIENYLEKNKTDYNFNWTSDSFKKYEELLITRISVFTKWPY